MEDQELRDHLNHLDTSLSAMRDYIDTALSAMESRLVARMERAAEATAAEIGALHTYIHQAEARFNLRHSEQRVRIDRHAALLQSGARQLMRTFDNQEELNRLWRELDERGSNLEKRLFALERPRDGNEPSAAVS